MNKSFIYKILYYTCFVFSIITWIGASNSVNIFGLSMGEGITTILGIFNLVLVIVFSIKLIKNKLESVNIMFPILYLLFLMIVVILAFVMNGKLMIQNIHFGYYISFIALNYLLLNLYSVLSFVKKK